MAKNMATKPTSREHTTMTKYSGPIEGLPNASKPIRGKRTRSDMAPMSTGAYSSHCGKYESHANGAGNRH